MAYSQFLQYKAFKLGINIEQPPLGGEILICRVVLEALDEWLTVYRHEKVLSAVDMLQNELFAVKNEIDTMYRQGQLMEFLQSNIIASIENLRRNIQDAYSHAYAAGEKEYDDPLAASQSIYYCHDCIQRALADIAINRQ